MLSVRLFGELELRMGDERLPRLESARARSLLAYLLLHRDAPQSRQRLAYLLWPDSSEGQARTNLRHLIHTLRQAGPALDQFLDVTPQTVWWRNDIASWVDVTAFETAQAAADAPGISSAREREALREAIDLYRGDLLDGCYDEWVLDVRARLRDRYLTQLHRLAGILADDGEHAEAIRVGRELLRVDPLREETSRFLMLLHTATGDRAGAVRVYHECVSTLRRELGVEPSNETVAEYAALTSGAPSDVAEPPPTLPARSALVGRDAEWQRLSACWRDAGQGGVHLVLVSGEPGVGKTRLVEELAAWCSHSGAIVAQARSYPTEGELGYGVVISWLRAGDVAAQLRQASGADLAVLGRLLPELATTDPQSDVDELDATEHRQRLFDAIARSLAGSGRPTLLVADDAQWCDEQSLQLVHYLLRSSPTSPLLVVATARREDVDDRHPLGALVGGLQIIDRATEISVDRLDREATAQLARDLAGTDLDRVALDGLFADTEGNPLFIVETVRAGWDHAAPSESKLTPKLQAVLSDRLRQLSRPARELLDMAATVGREFTTDVIAGALERDDLDFVRGLDELWRRGLVREHGTDAYDFAHGKIRDAAYEALSPVAARHNHRVIADTLVRVRQRDLDSCSGEIARHYDHGGQPDEAVMWYRRAAVQAQRMHANIEAIRLLDHARDLVAVMSPDEERDRTELEIVTALATPIASTDGFASPRLASIQRDALALAGVLGVEPDSRLLRSVAMTNLSRNDFDGSRAVAIQLRSAAEKSGDDVLRIESEYLLGIAAFWSGALDEARAHFERVVADFDPRRRVEHIVRFGQDPWIVCLSRLANTLWFLGFTDESRRARDDALKMAVEVGHPFSRGVMYVFAALLCVDLDENDRYREMVGGMAGDARHHPFAVAEDALRGYAEVLEGNAQQGIERIRSAIATSSVDHAPGQRATHTRLLVAAFHAAGDPARGLAAADEALQMAGTRLFEPEVRRLRALFLHALNATTDEVDAELDRAVDAARRMGALGAERRVQRTRSDIAST